MKKSLMLVIALFCLIAVNTASAQSSSDQGLIGRARGAAHDCLEGAGQGFEINASVETYSICFVSGELRKVVFYGSVKCHQEPCPKIKTSILATVYFGCDNEITSVECAN